MFWLLARVKPQQDCWRCYTHFCKGITHVLLQNFLSATEKQPIIHTIKLRVYVRCFIEYFHLVFVTSFNGWSHITIQAFEIYLSCISNMFIFLTTSIISLWNKELPILEEYCLINQTLDLTICIYSFYQFCILQ